MHEHLCFLLFLLRLSSLSCISLGLGQTKADVLEVSSVGAELSPSASLESETDRLVINTIELQSLGACVKPGTSSLLFILSPQHSPPTCFPSHILPPYRCPPHYLASPVTPLLPVLCFPLHCFIPSSSSPSPLDLDVKASQAVWSLSAGCQGRDTAHWDPEWDKLTVTMFPLSMWSWEKEKVKRRA